MWKQIRGIPECAVRFCGAPGTVRGVAEIVVDGEPVPAALVARTVNE